MRSAERGAAEFYFALPRLVAHLRGANSDRTENNWIEANIAGAAVMLVSFLAISSFLWSASTLSMQIILLLPTVVITWLVWLLVLYVDAQLIKVLRAVGLLRGVPNARLQSLFISTITTVFACYLLNREPFLGTVAAVWIVAVFANLLATVVLAFLRHRHNAG
ncbi:MAG: hypothetical protein H0X73_03855 [Chthoniobacterales bacterium]|nr:hypothetical protein [Chthoniobacterales bacterium]